jgi:hypothetical protein
MGIAEGAGLVAYVVCIRRVGRDPDTEIVPITRLRR